MYFVLALMMCAAAWAADYTTYIGDANEYQVTAIAMDASGNTYVTGSRAIVSAGARALVPAATDVFVSKVDAAGTATLLATWSGKSSEVAHGIALDPSGNIYVAGVTTSTNFPLLHPLQRVGASGGTGFLVKLSADGTILFSTYLGGTLGSSALNSVAADSQGNVYVTGSTNASDYPRTPGLPAGLVSRGPLGAVSAAFFAKISAAGDKILYAGGISATQHACGAGSTCFVSPISTSGASIAVDAAGNAYLAGNTYGGGLATTAGALRTEGIGAFVAKVNPGGTGLVYLTLLGAANYIPGGAFSNSAPGNFVTSIAADAAGNAYISGATSDPAFPATTGVVQSKISVPPASPFSAPPSDAFVAKLNPGGSAVVWATFLGGARVDQARTIGVDPSGNVWVSGITDSSDFPASLGWPSGPEFLVELNPSGSALNYSARFPENYTAAALAVDPSGVVHHAGLTGLVTAFLPGSAFGRLSVARVFGVANAAGSPLSGRIAPGELISIHGVHLGPTPDISSQFNAAGFLPTSLAGTQVMLNSAVPLLYASGTQINAVAPGGLAPGAANLRVIQDGAAAPDFRVVVDAAAPQVFRQADQTAIAVNADGTLNSQSHQAKAGSYVAIWATGTGFYPGPDGQMASSAEVYCSCEIRSYGSNTAVRIAYAGAAPGTVNGVVQINFQVTADTGYYLNVNGKNSSPFFLSVTP